MSELNQQPPDASANSRPDTPKPRKKSRVFFWTASIVAVLALVVVAVPNFVKSRTTACLNSCIANLKQIDGAVQQWALENKKTAKDAYSLTDPNLLQYLKGSTLPICPAGGRYSAGRTVAEAPVCTLAKSQGHSL